METQTDIALIGAGPLGIELAVALKKANLRYAHFEANQIGATMQWWSPGTRWFSSADRISIAGVPLSTPLQEKASREEYLAYLRSVVLQFKLDIHTYTRVTNIQKTEGGFQLTTQKSIGCNLLGEPSTTLCKKIILATGGTDTPNLLNIPGENLPHVSHYFQDPHTYFQKNLLIVGGRNSAVEAALRAHRAGAQVHFCYRRENVDPKDIKYWLYPEFSSLVKAGKIVPHFNTTLVEITPTNATLSSCLNPLEKQNIPIDFALLLTGYRADMSLAKLAGVTLTTDQDCPTYNSDTMETNIPNIYIAGTAIAGTQKRYKIFLENCHVHVDKILAHLTGHSQPSAAPTYDSPES